VLHRKNIAMVPIEHGRYLAEHIPRATLVELEGADVSLVHEGGDLVVDLIEEFITGQRRGGRADRGLATVLFTDIVGSTLLASRLGDSKWREMLDAHDRLARDCVELSEGRLVKLTGDGIMPIFDGPGRGIQCAGAFREGLRAIGTEVRIGLHTGEIELRQEDIGGLTVHVAARVMAEAEPGEVLVSESVRDLVAGSDVALEDKGMRELKGVEGKWRLFAVTGT
jgi:class 3 adenylate cyclase